MNKISISQAWAYATSFFSDQHPNHAIALIGVGVAVPTLLNLLLGGAATMDPAALAAGTGSIAALGSTMFLIGILGFILQMGSYFASWRMGLTPGQESVGSALSYGLIAALPVLLVTMAFIIVIGVIFALLFGGAILPVLMGGGTPSDSQVLGSLGMMVFVFPLFLVAALWLSARFSVMGPVMAANRTYNPLTGLAESWRMTAASQWKIMGYFVLIGIIIVIISTIFAMIFGISMLAGGEPGTGTMVAMSVMGAIIGIPLAYVYVGVPAGIYKAIGGGDSSDVFA
ncbi:MAG: hypothetical protein HC788_04355 [Sphingopyxis sp.]|nr:hypothetical protein [Sphingopyxis sp.]